MESPCPRCGTYKTESVRHGFIYDTLWNMGYHLRCCSFCNRWRVFKRMDRSRPHPDDMTAEQLRADFNRKLAESMRGESGEPGETSIGVEISQEPSRFEPVPGESSIGVAEAPEEIDEYCLCPKCGSSVYRRSRRRWFERLLKRPKMARCMRCSYRFPYPSRPV